MKKLLFAAALSVFLCPSAFAAIEVGDAVKLARGSNFGTGGGVFNVDDLNEGGTVDFQTFCVEVNEHIGFGKTYYVSGIGNANTSGKVLGTDAAWLYTQFREGDITLGSTDEANAMQLGIWRGMGYDDVADTLPALASFALWDAAYVTDTLNAILNGWFTSLATDFAAWTSHGPNYTGGVEIMNLLTASGGAVQDQIIWTAVPDTVVAPLPEPATLAIWASLASLGLVVAARHRA